MGEAKAQLPESWVHARLGELGNWVGGGTPSKANASFWADGDIPWISPKDMKVFRLRSSQDCITEAAVLNSTATLLPSGVVLVVTRSGILQHTLPVAVSQVPATVNQDLKAMVPYPEIDPTYVAYALKARERDILETCSKDGTTVQSIDSARLYAFPIPIAPLTEQHRIVTEIETQLTRLDAAIASLERTRANLKRYRAAVLKAACEGRLVSTEAELARAEGHGFEIGDFTTDRTPIDAADQEDVRAQIAEQRSTLADLPELPDGWRWLVFKSLVKRSEYGTSTKSSYEADGFPVLRIPNIARGRIDLSDLKYSTVALDLKSEDFLLEGDILMCRTNGSVSLIGKTALVDSSLPDGYTFASYLLRFRLINTKTLPTWVSLYLGSTLGRQYIESHAASSAGQHNVSLSLIHRMPIPVPPPAEQDRIVAEVERRFSVLDEMEQTVAHGLKRAARLRQAIMHQAFTGQLVPQDPDDEPASVLLDRIRAERAATSNGKPTQRLRSKPSR